MMELEVWAYILGWNLSITVIKPKLWYDSQQILASAFYQVLQLEFESRFNGVKVTSAKVSVNQPMRVEIDQAM